jgi:Nuclease-related domain
MLREERKRHAAASTAARSRYENALAQHRLRLDESRARRDQARSQHRWWTWLRCAVAWRRERQRAPRRPATAMRASDQEEILTAGMAGEEMAAIGLGRLLGDDWTLLRGYRNRGGEIDQLLLGPGGLIAIEVKHRNATVHCDGDEWWFDKYDRYGNLVDQGRIRDRRGRSPSAQLNEPASLLEEFLRSRGCPARIERVVLLTHPRSRIGTCRNPTVRMATSADDIIELLRRSRSALDATRRARLQQLIVRDHRFHESRRTR